MKKLSISALALAAMGIAPAAQAIEFEPTDNSTFAVYGEVAPSLKSEKNGSGDWEFQYADEDSILGINGEHRITDEFQLYASAEFLFFSDDSTPSFEFDEGWFGIKGDSWGSIQAGGQENPFTYLINDNVNVAEIAEITGDDQLPPENNMFVYRSPSINGFSVAGKLRVLGEGDGVQGDVTQQDETEFDVGGVAGYSGENFTLRAAYTTVNTRTRTITNPTPVFGTDPQGNQVQVGTTGGTTGFTDGAHYGVTGDVSFGPATIAAKVAEASFDNATDLTRYAGTGIFRYGQFIDQGSGKLYGSVQQVERDNNNRDWTEITVGVDYKPIDNFKVYGEAGWFDRQNDAGDVIGVGAIYSF
jgi:hypothetical protein